MRGNRNIENHTHLKKIAYGIKHEIVFFFFVDFWSKRIVGIRVFKVNQPPPVPL